MSQLKVGQIWRVKESRKDYEVSYKDIKILTLYSDEEVYDCEFKNLTTNEVSDGNASAIFANFNLIKRPTEINHIGLDNNLLEKIL